MSKETFKLGPRQEAWLQRLETAPPERQITVGRLGIKYPNGHIRTCCLGEALFVLDEEKANEQLDKLRKLMDTHPEKDQILKPFRREQLLTYSYHKMGLYDSRGAIQGNNDLKGHHCLSQANDKGVTWKEIAAFIRANPIAVFKESK